MPKDDVTFPKLNRSNHSTWRIRMVMHLTRLGLWGIVNGSEECPAGAPTSKAVREYNARLNVAWSEMGLRVEDSQLGYFAGLESEPATAWKKLDEVHKAGGFATILQLKSELSSTKRHPHESVQDHIARLDEIRRRLKDLGAAPSQQDFVAALLKQPDSYAPLLVGLNFLPPDQITETLVISHLVTEETRQNGVSLNSSSWNSTGASSSSSNAAFVASTGPCTRCHCPNAGRNCGRPQRDATNITCFNCLEKGHFMSACTKPKRVADTGNGNVALIAYANMASDTDHAF